MKNRTAKRIAFSVMAIFITTAAMATQPAQPAELRQLMNAAGMNLVRNRDMAPDFELKNLKGKTVKLSDYRNKIVMLNFMATWCYWCKKEMPHLQKLYQKFRGKDFAIVVVFQDRQGARTVVPFIKQSGYTFSIDSGLLDPTGVVGYRYGVTGTPTTWLIDRSGKILGWGIGYRDWFSPPAIELIETLVASPPASTG